MVKFFKDVWFEMTQKVSWPSFKRLRTALAIILSFVMIWSLVIFAFDAIFIQAQSTIINDYYDTVALKKASDGNITIDQVKKFATAAERNKYMADEEAKGTPGYGKNPDAPVDGANPGGTTIPISPGEGQPGMPITIPGGGLPGGNTPTPVPVPTPPTTPPTGNP